MAKEESSYDVVVIGGGISGVQIARHSAGRGLNTLLVEKNDFGHATSAATTKAIHGGLRYLEQLDFAVVAESIRERRYLTLAAPHLVQPRSFLLTTYDWSAPPAPVLGAGVALYEAMAFNRNVGVPRDVRSPRFTWVGKQKLLRRVPWLEPEGLQGAWRHDDSLNLHPERLLLAMVKDFESLGGTALNHTEAVRVNHEDGRVTGVKIVNKGETHTVLAQAVINAAGPWVERALGDVSSQAQIQVKQAKGVHLITDDLGMEEAVYVRGRNGRHIVVNPWEGRTLVGPTDTPSPGDPDNTHADESDINLLRETFDSVSARPLTRDSVQDTIVGVRPLIDDGSDTYTASRRFEVRDHASQGLAGLFTVSGGKWTTGRAMGEKVVGKVVRAMGADLPPVKKFDDKHRPLSSSFGDYATIADAFDVAFRAQPEADVPLVVREHLARLYGTEHLEILELVASEPNLSERLWPGESNDIAAQAVYAVTHEKAATLADVIDRRLTVGTLGAVPAEVVKTIAGIVAPLLGWDEQDVERETQSYVGRVHQRAETLDRAFSTQ